MLEARASGPIGALGKRESVLFPLTFVRQKIIPLIKSISSIQAEKTDVLSPPYPGEKRKGG